MLHNIFMFVRAYFSRIMYIRVGITPITKETKINQIHFKL